MFESLCNVELHKLSKLRSTLNFQTSVNAATVETGMWVYTAAQSTLWIVVGKATLWIVVGKGCHLFS